MTVKRRKLQHLQLDTHLLKMFTVLIMALKSSIKIISHVALETMQRFFSRQPSAAMAFAKNQAILIDLTL